MTHSSAINAAPDDRPIWDLLFGAFYLPAVLVAHELGLFRALAEKPLSLEELCTRFTLAPRALAAVLSICAARDLLVWEAGCYRLTPLAEDFFLRASDTYFGGFLDIIVANYDSFSFAQVKQAVQTNQPQIYEPGQSFWTRPEDEQWLVSRAYTLGMHAHSMAAAQVWPEKIDLSEHRLMLDLGGGSGAHSIGAALRWPQLRCEIRDLPMVVPVAAPFLEYYGVAERVTTCAGDMFTDALPPADVHFYGDIFHDWTPAQCRTLTERSFAALETGGRIILHEMLFNQQKTGPPPVAAYNLAMLLWTSGQQFSQDELCKMLADAGFSEIECRPAQGYWNLVTGRKP